MKSKTLGIVAGVAAISAALAAVLVIRSREATAVQEYSGRIYPELDTKAKDVASIVVNAGGVTSTVQKKDNTWVLAEKGGYPVKLDKVKEIVGGLSELRQLEPKTSKPELYSKIGVEDPPAQPAPAPAEPLDPSTPPPERSPAALVTLKDAAGGTIVAAILGKQQPGNRPAIFIRKAGEAQSWLAEGRIDLPRDASAWFETQIINLTRDRVKSASITPGRADGSPLVVSRQKKEDANFAVEAMPEGRALTAPTAADGAATALSYMTFEDVAPASSVAVPDGVMPTSYELRTFDGLVVVAKVFQKDGKYWVSFAESVDEAALPKADPATSVATPAADPATPADPTKPPADPAADPAKLAAEEAAKKAEEIKKAEELKKEVADFNRKHGGWVYAISEYRGKALVTKLEDLLAAPAPAATTGPAGPPTDESPEPAPAPDIDRPSAESPEQTPPEPPAEPK